jgi:hypothetical protein
MVIPGISETSRNLTSGRLSGTYEKGTITIAKKEYKEERHTFLPSLALPFLKGSSAFPAAIAGTAETGSESIAIDFK